MTSLDELALAIDAAGDAGDENLLRQLADECEARLTAAAGEDRVLLRYYQSNAHAAIIAARQHDPDHVWSWEQPDGIRNILLLRQAINEPAFGSMHPVTVCQIRTNLANRLSSIGRFVAANEQWEKALDVIPRFAKALAARGQGISSFARTLYDDGHVPLLLAAARSSLDAALADDRALWESGDRDIVAPGLVRERGRIASFLQDVAFDESFDLSRWSLGSTEEERSYRSWCLKERLFLNPLNEVSTATVAATDVLHLPDHRYQVGESPRFPAYYNLLKQEYVSARYRLYSALHEADADFIMNDVLMLDSGEGQVLGHYTDNLRSAFRSSYSIFDKIGLFLNDFFDAGLKAREVTFRRIWSQCTGKSSFQVNPTFRGRRNWPLRGLYFLSKDLFDKDFADVSEPDAGGLARLRQQAEHRFLGFQGSAPGSETETYQCVSIEEFEGKALRLVKMAREALIYLSLAMHGEERSRNGDCGNGDRLTVPLVSWPIENFDRF